MASLGGFCLVIICVATIGFFLGVILNHFLPLLSFRYGRGRSRGRGRDRDIPKGSFGWPLVGETLSFLKPHPSYSIGAFLQEHCSRYGKVFKSHLFLSPTIVSCDQDLNYLILQNEDKLFQCSYPKPIHGILGEVSLLVSVGETHKKLRNVALSLVTTIKSNPQFLSDVEAIAVRILDSWKYKEQIIFCEEARKFTFNVIVKQVLGLTQEDPETTRILEDFVLFMRGLISLPLYIPGTPYARAVQARSRISSSVKAIIERRRRRSKGEKSSTSSSGDEKKMKGGDDFLDVLLSVEALSEDEKVSFVLDSLLGGYETTSLLMAMAVHFLAHSPLALQQLKVEHESIRKDKREGEFLNWEDYKRMVFTQKVINETLRYGNIVKFVHRKALKDVTFKDYVIPAGWKVLPVFSAVHLDPSLHADALHFNPWRWQTEDQICKKFTPFGGGTRLCPGFELAKVEVSFFLNHLVLNYRWRVEDDDQPFAYPYIEFEKGLRLSLHHNSS